MMPPHASLAENMAPIIPLPKIYSSTRLGGRTPMIEFYHLEKAVNAGQFSQAIC
jgi:hypothetical protein